MKTWKLWIVPIALLVAFVAFYTMRRPAAKTTDPVYSLGEPIGNGLLTIAEGTASMLTAPIESEHCADIVTIPAAGVLAGEILISNFANDPSDIVGYNPEGGLLTISSYVSRNAVNFKVCNNTAKTITPGPVDLKWQVMIP